MMENLNIINRINRITSFFIINYKSCLLYFICSFVLCDYNILLAIICFIFGYFVCYLGHRCMHIDLLYFNIHSISHVYHHNNTSWFAYILNYVIEYLTITDNIVIKYIFNQFGINCFFINEWITLFLYFIYTTVHNINYGIFKVNKYHFYHHDNASTNIGPDIFDFFCISKNSNTIDHECIDHYIPNIIGAFCIVWILKSIYLTKKYNDLYFNIFISLFSLSQIFCIIVCIYIFYHQINDIIYNDWLQFIKNGVNENDAINENDVLYKEKIEFRF